MTFDEELAAAVAAYNKAHPDKPIPPEPPSPRAWGHYAEHVLPGPEVWPIPDAIYRELTEPPPEGALY